MKKKEEREGREVNEGKEKREVVNHRRSSTFIGYKQGTQHPHLKMAKDTLVRIKACWAGKPGIFSIEVRI